MLRNRPSLADCKGAAAATHSARSAGKECCWLHANGREPPAGRRGCSCAHGARASMLHRPDMRACGSPHAVPPPLCLPIGLLERLSTRSEGSPSLSQPPHDGGSPPVRRLSCGGSVALRRAWRGWEPSCMGMVCGWALLFRARQQRCLRNSAGGLHPRVAAPAWYSRAQCEGACPRPLSTRLQMQLFQVLHSPSLGPFHWQRACRSSSKVWRIWQEDQPASTATSQPPCRLPGNARTPTDPPACQPAGICTSPRLPACRHLHQPSPAPSPLSWFPCRLATRRRGRLLLVPAPDGSGPDSRLLFSRLRGKAGRVRGASSGGAVGREQLGLCAGPQRAVKSS